MKIPHHDAFQSSLNTLLPVRDPYEHPTPEITSNKAPNLKKLKKENLKSG